MNCSLGLVYLFNVLSLKAVDVRGRSRVVEWRCSGSQGALWWSLSGALVVPLKCPFKGGADGREIMKSGVQPFSCGVHNENQ